MNVSGQSTFRKKKEKGGARTKKASEAEAEESWRAQRGHCDL